LRALKAATPAVLKKPAQDGQIPLLAATPVGVSPICLAALTPVTSAWPAPFTATSPSFKAALTAGRSAFSLELTTLVPSFVVVTAIVTKSAVFPIVPASSTARAAKAKPASARSPRPSVATANAVDSDGLSACSTMLGAGSWTAVGSVGSPFCCWAESENPRHSYIYSRIFPLTVPCRW